MLLRAVARAVPISVSLNAGGKQTGAGVKAGRRLRGWVAGFALAGTMPQGSLIPWVVEQEDGGLELPFPCQGSVCVAV